MDDTKLPDKTRRIVDCFVDKLKSIYGDALVSVVIYGSASSGDYAEKYSNINLAVVLKDTSITSIKKASRLILTNKYSIINPIFFTQDYIKKSLDVFPIEFLDIKENHSVLYGIDPFKDIQVDLKNLRFQCEHDIKSNILNIKKAFLGARRKALLKNVLFKSLTSSIHIFRNLLRLNGKVPSYKKDDVLNDISCEFNLDVSGLRKMLDARNSNSKLSALDIEYYFEELVRILECISEKIDTI